MSVKNRKRVLRLQDQIATLQQLLKDQRGEIYRLHARLIDRGVEYSKALETVLEERPDYDFQYGECRRLQAICTLLSLRRTRDGRTVVFPEDGIKAKAQRILSSDMLRLARDPAAMKAAAVADLMGHVVKEAVRLAATCEVENVPRSFSDVPYHILGVRTGRL